MESSQARAERIITEELAKLGWTEAESSACAEKAIRQNWRWLPAYEGKRL